MNYDRKRILFSLCLSLWLGVTGFSFAVPIRVTTDISSISGLDFELEFALDGAGAVAASVFLDNIIIKDSGGTRRSSSMKPALAVRSTRALRLSTPFPNPQPICS